MDNRDEQRLAECYRLLEETGDAALCARQFPDLAAEIEAYARIQEALVALIPAPGPLAAVTGRRSLLSALAARREAPPLVRRLSYASLGGSLVAVVLMGLAVFGVSAATGHGIPYPVDHILSDVAGDSTNPAPGDAGSSAPEPATEPAAAAGDVNITQEATPPEPTPGEVVTSTACAPGSGCSAAVAGTAEPTPAALMSATAAAPTAVAGEATATGDIGPSDNGNANNGGQQNGKTPSPPNGKTPPGQNKQDPGPGG